MEWSVVACDYDGTLATHGSVPTAALEAVSAFRANGGRFVLVTGRRAAELLEVFPQAYAATDLVVVENGGVLMTPHGPRLLADALPAGTPEALAAEEIHDYELGELLVSTWREAEPAVRRVAAALEAEWPCQVVPNKDRVMLLPAKVDKGSGLRAAATELGIEAHQVLALGDGENDTELLLAAGLGVAVADAVDSLKQIAGKLTRGPASAGVTEVLQGLLDG